MAPAKFILTKELGRLARWLRILGFDATYFNQDKLSSLVIQALREERLIITRNQHLPKSGGLRIVWLSCETLKEQIAEVLKALHLELNPDIMFSRCILCNLELKPIAKEEVKEKIPAYVYQSEQSFFTCTQCKRIYWQGTHWGNVTKTLEEMRGIHR
jgi:uncharacterized protein with PIN domain